MEYIKRGKLRSNALPTWFVGTCDGYPRMGLPKGGNYGCGSVVRASHREVGQDGTPGLAEFTWYALCPLCGMTMVMEPEGEQ